MERRGSSDREASSEAQVEHEISECIAAEDWKKVIDLGQTLAFGERVNYLWLWPLQSDFERIGECLQRYGIGRVLSIGCGTGLLEWLITAATGIVVAGIEKDENWWRSKYAKRTYIPMVFADALTNVTENQGQPTWQAMMFCYFNNGVAFREYVKNFKGHYVIIAGPIEGNGVHTDPLPFSAKFPADQEWERVQAFSVGSENLNHFVIYQRR
ncbi:uncharacterized protein LOC135697490 [Ochlerotatus camptorhynchus]|uniref:uncharacterized protein LOC135697490 n=1 Tax=Ochlerotatus camptorhynchus TaxID=644619 RepID=UPI0031DF71FD